MKVALVYDRVNKFGGAERVLLELHKLFPDAPLYTAVYNRESAPWANEFLVIPSFMQKLPRAKTNHEIYPWLTPIAFESFDFSKFDLVISITSAEAKGIITRPGTLHLCYCLTPTRYLWSGSFEYSTNLITKPIVSRLRLWDQIASTRPDKYIAISKTVSERIKKYYHRDSEVIFPPVDTVKYQLPNVQSSAPSTKHQSPITNHPTPNTAGYFLIVSRLVPYKRIDIAVNAFNQLKLSLKIIGTGSELKKLKSNSHPNIEFLGQLTDQEVLSYYQNCQAVIFPTEDDFGLVPLEAQACGKPVIAYRAGGAEETIIEGKTGEFFDKQDPHVLAEQILKFSSEKYHPDVCRGNALKFSSEVFKQKFIKSVEQLVNEYRKI